MLRQEWHDVLFANWALPPERLRPLVPAPLELEQYDGRAWVSVTPFRLRGLRPVGFPSSTGLHFPELNVRTYVRCRGRSGVFFFSLDAGSDAAVAGARTFFRLPYHRADMSAEAEGDWVRYRSRRRQGAAEFLGRYRGIRDEAEAPAGSLTHWLVERYSLFSVTRSGRVLEVVVRHRPWRVRAAEAEIERNSMAEAAGITLPDEPPELVYGAFVDVWTSGPRLVV